jgi:tetratricopeptide (TPR) repeat protein
VSRIVFTLFALSLSLICEACLNDRDTHEMQLTPSSDEKIILGLFRRYPAKYFEHRIARLEKGRSQQNGLTFAEYDDLSVAYDRIGRSDRALKLITEKFSLMSSADVKSVRWKTDIKFPRSLTPKQYLEYTTEANWGTFLIHDFFASGRDKKKLGQVKEGIRHLEHAVEINPDAHSGREWAQIEIAKWLYNETMNPTGRYPKFKKPPAETRRGLLGLVELGNAWESIDIFRMVAANSFDAQDTRGFAILRARELESNGKKPLFPGLPSPPLQRMSYIDATFEQGRHSAFKWSELFQNFVIDGIEKGTHPDTHANFMQNAPAMPNIVHKYRVRISSGNAWTPVRFFTTLIVSVLGVGVAFVAIRAIRRAR